MVRVLLDKIPPGVIQKELRGKRSFNRKVDGTFDLGKRIDKKRAKDDKLWEFAFCVPSTTWARGPVSGVMFLKLMLMFPTI